MFEYSANNIMSYKVLNLKQLQSNEEQESMRRDPSALQHSTNQTITI